MRRGKMQIFHLLHGLDVPVRLVVGRRVHAPLGEIIIHTLGLADVLAVAGAAGEHRRHVRVGLQILQRLVQPGPQGQGRLRAVDPGPQDDDRIRRQGRHVAAPPVDNDHFQPDQQCQAHSHAAAEAPADQPPAVIPGGQAVQQPGEDQKRRRAQQQETGKPDAEAPDHHQHQPQRGAHRRGGQADLPAPTAPVAAASVQGPRFTPLPLH